jgi:RimJ/RimL family protein N-acetyltransferase
MPTFAKHVAFMESNPYPVWYIIECGHHMPVGHTYLSKSDEIGIFVTKSFHGKGIGTKAIEQLMSMHKRDRYLANINPQNDVSQALFNKLGFKRIQFTYEKCPVSSGVTV